MVTGDRRGDRHARHPITWRPAPELRDRLEASAQRRGVTVRQIIAAAVTRELDEDEDQERRLEGLEG